MTGAPDIRVTPFALPGLLGEIARAVGQEAAVTIAEKFGGRELYIPRTGRADHRLTLAVGIEVARTIGAQFCGTHHIPSAKPFLRWREVHRLRDEGKSTAEISVAVGLGQRYVQRLLEGHEAPPPARRPRGGPAGAPRPIAAPRPIKEAERIEAQLKKGRAVSEIAATVGVSPSTVRRVKRQIAGAAP